MVAKLLTTRLFNAFSLCLLLAEPVHAGLLFKDTASGYPLGLWGGIGLCVVLFLPLVLSKRQQPSFRKLATRWNTTIFISMVFILLVLNILSHIATYQNDAHQIEQQIYHNARQQVREHTQLIIRLIEQEHLIAHERLRNELEEDLTRISQVVEQIIHQHGATLTPTQRAQKVRQKLDVLHSLYGHHAIAIVDKQGEILFSSCFPQRVGQPVVDFPDMGGTQLLPRIKSLSQSNSTSVSSIYPETPQRQANQEEHILYVRYFPQMDAGIVQGLDHANFERRIKQQLIKRLESLRISETISIFGGTFEGISLFGPAQGQNVFDVTDSSGVKVVQELIAAAQQGGGYVEYQMPEQVLRQRTYPKLSYSQKVSNWDWYIGAGIDLNTLVDQTGQQQTLLMKTITWNTINTSLAAAIIVLFLHLLTRNVSRRIERSIVNLNKSLDEAASHDVTIDVQSVEFEEFANIAQAANHMLHQRQQMVSKILAREEDLSVTLDSIADAVIVTDQQGCVTRMNPVAEQLTGWRWSEAEGESLARVYSTELPHSQQNLFDQVMATQSIVEHDEQAILYSRQGVCYRVAQSASPICGNHAEIQGVIVVFRDVTHTYIQQQAMRENELRMRLAIRGAQLILWDYDVESGHLSIDRSDLESLQFCWPTKTEMTLQQLFSEYCHPDDQLQVLHDFSAYTQETATTLRCEFRLRLGDGRWRWLLATGEALSRQQDQDSTRVIGMFLDIDDLKSSELALQDSEKRFRTMVNNAPLMVSLLTPEMEPVFVNEKWATATGYPLEALYQQFESVLHATDQLRLQQAVKALCCGEQDSYRMDLRYVSQSNSLFDIDTSLAPIYDQHNQVQFVLLMASDITGRRLVEKRLEWLALYDELTRLANRSYLYQHLESLLQEPDKAQRCWLYMLDLDRFKNINDNYGHAIGDQLLVGIGKRLNHFVEHNGGFVARLSGDEFIYISDTTLTSTPHQVAEQLIALVTEPVICSNIQLAVRTSIGVVPVCGNSSSEVLRKADMAMYEAKRHKTVTYQIYDDVMDVELRQQLRLEEDLKRGLQQPEQFTLHYQPIWNLATRQLYGFEALIRWNHPQLGWIAPDRFIPIAEETSMIVPLGRLILDRACCDLQHWLEHYPHLSEQPFRVSVNVAPQEMMTTNFVENACRITERYQVPPRNLCFEITETTVMEDPQLAIERIRRLKELGYFLSMDDFGTGYSSLSYLNQFEVNTIKLDRSLINEIDQGGTSKKVSDAIIRLSHELNFKVVAEGVETADQLTMLRNLQCDYIQGYLTGRPVPAAEVDAILEQRTFSHAL